MKIVHINYSDSEGGAAIAASRHCEAMRRAGIDSHMLVLNKKRKYPLYVSSIFKDKRKEKIETFILVKTAQLFSKLFQTIATFSFPFYTVSISKHPLIREADIIYLHWVAGSMLSTKEIERILKLGKPVRWYMHDMNPITGGCHHSFDCVKYQMECKKCPLIKKRPPIVDISTYQFRQRIKRWSKYKNLEAYAPSTWLGDCIRKSSIWKGHNITVFPNVIDTDKFHPEDKNSAKKILNINTSKKIILFGAADINNPYKGWAYMREALNQLNPDIYEAIIFGEENSSIKKDLAIETYFTGYLYDEISLILIYNAADVFVSSSLAENYPNVIMEAMACGTPCVGFNIGGIPDQIKHKVNGYLAKSKDANDLANGIKYVCESNSEQYSQMQQNARDFVCNTASFDLYKSNF